MKIIFFLIQLTLEVLIKNSVNDLFLCKPSNLKGDDKVQSCNLQKASFFEVIADRKGSAQLKDQGTARNLETSVNDVLFFNTSKKSSQQTFELLHIGSHAVKIVQDHKCLEYKERYNLYKFEACDFKKNQIFILVDKEISFDEHHNIYSRHNRYIGVH